MNTRTTTILGVKVTVNAPYEEGHEVNAAEAAVLNQTRAENVGNNLRKDVKLMLEGGKRSDGTEVPKGSDDEGNALPATVKEIEALVAGYDKDYDMSKVTPRRGALSDLEKLTRDIARQNIADHLAAEGKTVSAVRKENLEGYNAAVEKIASNPKVIAAAKKQLAERQGLSVIDGGLDL